MSTNKIATTNLIVWVFSAMTGAIAFYADGNWPGILVWGSVLSLLIWLSLRFGEHWDGTVYHFAQCLWLSVILSQLLGYSANCWPTGEHTFPVVPLSLLLLATLSACKGSDCTAKGVCVLFWIMAALIGVVVIAGIPELNIAFLQPKAPTIKSQMFLVYLLPALSGFFQCKSKRIYPFVVVVIMGTLVSAWICGILSPEIAYITPWPFYESAKGVQIFDIAKRLESLVSVGVTVGNYALYSLLLCAVGNLGEKLGKRQGAVIVASSIAAAFMLFNIRIDNAILVVISSIFWIFLPLLGVFKRKVKK